MTRVALFPDELRHNCAHMTHNVNAAKTARRPAIPGGVARPLYIDSGASKLFGWLHLPETQRSTSLGVVICNPFGYESICAHRSVREFAEAFAAAGIPALRFDYSGTGDSGDVDENSDHLKLWSRDVISASCELKSRAGVDRVCLVGIRLGALLATLAAAESSMIDSMILIGPVVSGRRYVNELRMTQRAGSALSGSLESDAAAEARCASPQPLEAGGFTLSAATIEALAQVDLLSNAPPPVSSLLILDGDRLTSAKRWAERLSSSSIRLDYKSVPGLIEMSMTAPQFAVVPRAMISASVEWLTATAQADSAPSAPRLRPSGDDASAPLEISIAEPSDRRSRPISIRERPVAISSAGITLFGIVSEPTREEKRRRAVILLNPGADSHIGASRMYVSLARRWARRGYFALRVDLGGIGDSETRAGKRDDEVFPEEAIDDIRGTIEYMRTSYGVTDITVAGLCSGAYHALRAAAAGVALNRILMVNPQNYFWKKSMTLEQIQLAEVVHNPGLYRRRIFSWQAWTRIFTGQVDIARIAAIYLQRMRLAGEAVLRDAARRMRIPLPNDLGWDLERIVANGVGVTFLFARGEPGIALLKLQAGSTLERLEEQCHVRIVDSGDHIFSRRAPRALMGNVLSTELFANLQPRLKIPPAMSL
jgi:alpha-beta hydrolase superfamily lysophospholipase